MSNKAQTTNPAPKNKVTALKALATLKAGNARFVNSQIDINSLIHDKRRAQFAGAQTPFAIILSCADSRVPAEMVFDQGLGDLFVIRVAGNIVAPSLIGSVEFAAASFGTQLVVVMGHSNCGAVSAALDVAQLGSGIPSENIKDIVDRITPGILPVLDIAKELPQDNPAASRSAILERCVKANVMASVHQLKHSSKIIEELVQKGKLKVVGAEYNLETGRVDFFEPDLTEGKSNTIRTIAKEELHYAQQ